MHQKHQLAKQGMQMGTLLELARQNYEQLGRKSKFSAAVEYSKESLRTSLDKRMKRGE